MDYAETKSELKALSLLIVLLVGCGYSSRGNEVVAQVKYVSNRTPLLCPDYISAGVSLGVTKNGVGSMSTHDQVLVVPDNVIAETLKRAQANVNLVKLVVDEKRLPICVPELQIVSAEILP